MPSTALDDAQPASLLLPLTPVKVSQGVGGHRTEHLAKIRCFKLEVTDQLEGSRLSFPQQSTNEGLGKLSNGETLTFHLSTCEFVTQQGCDSQHNG